MAGVAVGGPSAYWYLTRGTGAVALVLLTVTVILGILDVERVRSSRWPRFVLDRLHRDASLLVLALIVVHVATSVLDGFAPLTLLDGIVPLHSSYRPLWLGLGALAFDLLLAVLITSLLRRRIGYRTWRLVHWLAYASWPLAAFHTLGAGSDAAKAWLIVLTAACVLAVAGAVVVRALRAELAPAGLRAGTLAAAALLPIGLAVFAVAGPLAPHWARRAGTPASVLRASAVQRFARSSAPLATGVADRIPASFTDTLEGTVRQRPAAGGAVVDLVLRCRGAVAGTLRVRLAGAPVPGGGLSLTGSQVAFTAVGLTEALEGRVDTLDGQSFAARVRNAVGTAVNLRADLNIDNGAGTVTGTLSGARG